MLEILGSTVNGFAFPLKDEHTDFLTEAVIPWHEVKSLASFYQQLADCMKQYVEKDPRLAHDIITFCSIRDPDFFFSCSGVLIKERTDFAQRTIQYLTTICGDP